jgi:hypothetical protein
MGKRHIMRIELSGPALKAFNSLSERFGMTQLSIDSRLIEWYATLDPTTQRRLMDNQANPAETARAVLEKMGK